LIRDAQHTIPALPTNSKTGGIVKLKIYFSALDLTKPNQVVRPTNSFTNTVEHYARVFLQHDTKGLGIKKAPRSSRRAFHFEFGDDLLSHAVSHAVPSALRSLTSVFGMGTGVSSPL
jgi:hypothetical protein